ncbi:hypothetical protein HRbin16_02175 [bacterium HR16]|nr:hypothetical protein HRbin16_02175 [bacterium HR16]
MCHLRIDKRDHARFVVEIESLHAVALVFLEATVYNGNRRVGYMPCFVALYHEKRVLYRHALCEVAVMPQRTSPVPHRKDRGNDFQIQSFTGLLYLLKAAEIFRRLFTERVQIRREHRAVIAMFRRILQHRGNLCYILAAVQPPAENPHPAVTIALG